MRSGEKLHEVKSLVYFGLLTQISSRDERPKAINNDPRVFFESQSFLRLSFVHQIKIVMLGYFKKGIKHLANKRNFEIIA